MQIYLDSQTNLPPLELEKHEKQNVFKWNNPVDGITPPVELEKPLINRLPR